MNITALPPPLHRLPAFINHLKPLIQTGEYSLDRILDAADAQEMVLWAAMHGEGICAMAGVEINTWPNGQRVGAIDFCTGENPELWVHLIKAIETDMRRQGVTRMRFLAREGYLKWLAPMGYRKDKHVRVEKELT